MTHFTWQLTGAVPPPAWAALLTDAKVLVAVARSRGVTVAGPAGTGQPILDSERIALSVRAGGPDRPFSLPFTFSRTLPAGELTTTDSALYDSIVLASLNRARRYFGALFTMSTDAGTATVAQATRLADLVFGADDRRLNGAPEPAARSGVEQIVAVLLDDLEEADDPRGVTTLLGDLVAALSQEWAGRVAAEAPTS